MDSINESNSKLSYEELLKQNTQLKNQAKEIELLLNEMGSMTKVGGWQLNLNTQKLVWTKELYAIHELDEDFEPTVEKAINYYYESSKKIITDALEKAIESGTPFNTDLKIITAKGNVVDVRAIGEVISNDDGKATFVSGTFQDITDNKRIEDALNKNQYYLSKAQEMGKIGAWELDIINNKLIWTKENYKNFGVKHGTPLTFEIFLNCIHPEDRDYVNSEWSAAIEGKPYDIEHRVVEDGKIKWLREKANLKFDENGNAISAIGFTQDITKFKETEQEILQNKILLESSIESTKDLIILSLDHNYRYLYFNKSHAEGMHFAYNTQPEIGKCIFDFMTNEQDIQNIRTHYNRALAGESHTISEEYGEGDARLYFEVRFNPIVNENNKIIGLTSFSYNVTQNMLSKQALLESEERFGLAMNASQDGLYDWDLVTNEIYYSTGWKKMLGYKDHELPNDFSIWEKLTKPEDIEKSWKMQQEVINKKRDRFELEFKMKHKDGNWVDVLSRAEAVFNNEGKAIRIVGTHVDISDRKKFENDIIDAKRLAEESEAVLKTTLQTAMNGYWVVDMKGYFLNVNDSYCRMSGYNKKDLLAMRISDVEAIQSHDEIDTTIQKIKQLGQLRFETKHIRKDGTLYDVEIAVQYQHNNNNNNNNEQIVCFIKDITEQKKHEAEIILAKEAAEQSKFKIALNEKRLNALVELSQMTNKSDDYIYDFTLNKAIELTQSKIGFLGFVNDDESEVDIYKWSDSAMKECAVRNINMNFVVEEAGIWGDVIRQRKALVLNDYSKPIQNKKGIPLGHVSIKNYLSIPTFQQKKIKAIISVSNKDGDYIQTDINQVTLLLDGMQRFLDQRKEKGELIIAKEKAEENQILYEGLVQSSHNLIWKCDLEGKFTFLNSAWENTHGYKVEEMLGRPFSDFQRPEVFEHDVIEFTRHLKGGFVKGYETTHIIKDGTEIPLIFNALPLLNSMGEIIGTQGTAFDISKLKQTELDLISAKEKAEESDRLKSAFLANMSHEIRTPMNGILGFTELLQDTNLSIENQKNYVGIIRKSSDRLLNTVNDIIEISKIESGDVNVAKSEVNLIMHLDTLVTFFRPESEKKGLKIIIQNNIGSNDLSITTDKTKLGSILSNLIKNAIKYTDVGTIKVGFKIENGQILFSCQDSGIGIPKNRFEAIFNRFEQADIEDKQAQQGSGLGLAIVKSYLEMMDGKIWVESEVGKGSTFYVLLPYSPVKNEEQDLSLKDKTSDSGVENINVLIVEDDEYSSIHLEAVMNGITKNIRTAQNGIEAVRACKNDSSIDLVLMDINMPEMDGFEAAKRIREFNKDVIIIAQTAFAFEEDKQNALSAGCTDFISKPIKKDKLFELINKYF